MELGEFITALKRFNGESERVCQYFGISQHEFIVQYRAMFNCGRRHMLPSTDIDCRSYMNTGRAGEDIEGTGNVKRRGRTSKVSAGTREKVLAMYRQGMSGKEIADLFGVTRDYVYKVAANAGLRRRRKSA